MKAEIIKKINTLEESIKANRTSMSQPIQTADQLEIAEASERNSLLLGTINRDELSLSKLKQALVNVEKDSFGFCDSEDCGEEIPEGRLKFNPAITKCFDCSFTQELRDKQVA
jgi:DnaK suppressor protein